MTEALRELKHLLTALAEEDGVGFDRLEAEIKIRVTDQTVRARVEVDIQVKNRGLGFRATGPNAKNCISQLIPMIEAACEGATKR